MRNRGAAVLMIALMAGCTAAAPQDKFETLMIASREGRDTETLKLAAEVLADPQAGALVKARTEMTAALAHIRSKRWSEARVALDRSKALGIETDTGYFRDHLAEYESWIQDAD